RSSELESRCCAWMSRVATVFVSSRMRSASVDLPWSMCAMMQKFRILSMLMNKHFRRQGSENGLGLDALQGGLPDVAGGELSGGPEGGAEPAGVVAPDLGRLDADLLDENAEDPALDAFADLVEEDVARLGHAAGEDDDVGVEDVDHVCDAGG